MCAGVFLEVHSISQARVTTAKHARQVTDESLHLLLLEAQHHGPALGQCWGKWPLTAVGLREGSLLKLLQREGGETGDPRSPLRAQSVCIPFYTTTSSERDYSLS